MAGWSEDHVAAMGFSTASLVGSGEKPGTDPWIGQPACCGLCQEPFSREQ
jgi:hypothetical protein